MKTIASIFRTAKPYLFVFAAWLLSSSLLLAKEGSTDAEAHGEGSWVFSYFLTGLSVVLGLLVICRASTRRDRVRPEAYSEGKVGRPKE
jgi:hypothetical protein